MTLPPPIHRLTTLVVAPNQEGVPVANTFHTEVECIGYMLVIDDDPERFVPMGSDLMGHPDAYCRPVYAPTANYSTTNKETP